MNFQDFNQFPFIDLGLFLIMAALAVQVLRGKLTGGVVEFVKANKGAFDEDTDELVVRMARLIRQKPSDTRRLLETMYVLATGETLNPEARAKLAEVVNEQYLKDIPVSLMDITNRFADEAITKAELGKELSPNG